MKEEILKPLNNKKENIFVLLFITFIILIAVFFIKIQNDDSKEIKLNSNEISSFNSFNSTENSIYQDLENFIFDLSYYENIKEFPSIDVLENDHVYPFVKDSLWETRGEILWKQYTFENKNIYLGLSKDLNITGNFLIESINKDDKIESLIYYTKENIVLENIQINKIKDQYAFKKVISLKGEKLTEDLWK